MACGLEKSNRAKLFFYEKTAPENKKNNDPKPM